MDAWEAMSTSGYDRLAGNPTETNGHDTHLYSNYMDKLGNKLQTLATDLRTEKDSRMSTEKRLVDTECRIHGTRIKKRTFRLTEAIKLVKVL